MTTTANKYLVAFLLTNNTIHMEEFSARDGLDLYNFINTWKPSKEAALFLAFGFASSDLLHVYWREGNIVKVNSNQWPKTLIHTALRANLTPPLIRATI